MTSNLNIGELARIAKEALDAKDIGQEFMLDDVCNVTRVAYEQHPEDPVIRQVAFTMERMTDKAPPGATISQAQISEVYNHFARLSGNSKFRQVLGHLLLEEQTKFSSQNPDFVRTHRVDAEDSGLDTSDFVNQDVVNALTAAFGGSIDSIKAFDTSIARKGKEFVEAELRALGTENPDVEVMGGNQNIIVYASHFDSRKGRVTVAIPTEVKDGRVLFPSTFVADDRLQELTTANLEYFIDKKAESNDFSVPKANDVLTAVGVLTGQVKTAGDDEAADQLAGLFGDTEKGMEMSTPNLYMDRKYEEGRPDIDTTQEVDMPQELAHLARDFEDNVLEAASTFGLEAIRAGKEMIGRELMAAGFRNSQVKFGSESGDSIVYLASIPTPKGNAEIEVPVEMQALASDRYVPLAPAYFAYDGLIEDFSIPKLQRFAISLPAPSSSSKVYSSAYYYMTLPELKDEILKAAAANDYVSCEAALGEIEEKFSEEDFKNAVADYHYLLMQKTHAEQHEQRKCAKMIPAGKGSIYARCGHYGVPMHQVMVDDEGNCRLKSAVEREKLNPNDEGGAAMSSAKIFMA